MSNVVADAAPGAVGFRLRVRGASAELPTYFSTNLVDWLPLLTNPPSSGPWEFFDTEAVFEPQRFYRAEE